MDPKNNDQLKEIISLLTKEKQDFSSLKQSLTVLESKIDTTAKEVEKIRTFLLDSEFDEGYISKAKNDFSSLNKKIEENIEKIESIESKLKETKDELHNMKWFVRGLTTALAAAISVFAWLFK